MKRSRLEQCLELPEGELVEILWRRIHKLIYGIFLFWMSTQVGPTEHERTNAFLLVVLVTMFFGMLDFQPSYLVIDAITEPGQVQYWLVWKIWRSPLTYKRVASYKRLQRRQLEQG